MSNVMRWRYGDTNPVMLQVASLTVIEIGDFIYQSGGAALPASELADAGTEAANQEAFHDLFVGVAMQASPSGVANPIRVATSGVFEFDCLATTAEVGDLLGVDEDGAGVELTNQLVAKVATANLAIGRCAKRANPAATRLLVEIVSTVLRGGPQVMA
ncbi:MAG: hypothetical protein JNL18_11460 [Planctomycetaceae bacterium]|uniref:Uncharacterized protein n=1 Tax=Lacipirellula limnantheis TaxID=2528024 RepID=A0A517U5W8_9BACT|nr:hypothetical protein [Lacipirellula limnantheis]MBL9163343.1 hypothetical protein [Planctomycetaceae bacterium]QDT76026.1 hypothetical protein I41_52710 [Lacipirellula limnantheis]